MTVQSVKSFHHFSVLSSSLKATSVVFHDGDKVFCKTGDKGLSHLEILELFREATSFYASDRLKRNRPKMYEMTASSFIAGDKKVAGKWLLVAGHERLSEYSDDDGL